MGMESLQKFFAYFLRVALILAVGYSLYTMAISYPPQNAQNYLKDYAIFLGDQGLNAFLGEGIANSSRGSLLLTFASIITVIGITQWIVGIWSPNVRSHIITTNRYYFVALWIIVFFSSSFDNAANTYGWYWDPVHAVEGRVDVWTHTLAGFNAALLVSALNFEKALHLDRRRAWFADIGIIIAVSAYWETLENQALNHYFNFFWNSMQDMFLTGLVGAVLGIFLYEKMVVELGI